jgi:hypothetical protein
MRPAISILFVLLASCAFAAPTVGVEGQVEVDLPGTLLDAKPVTDNAPLLLRVASTRPAVAQPPSVIHYDLRYIGLVPGQQDLKNFLVRTDGSSTADLPAIPVTVQGLLPPNHQGELVPDAGASWPWLGGYRVVMAGVIVLWLALLVPILRMGRKRRVAMVDAPPPAPPTFADRLRPLIDAAAKGELSTDDQGRLERMLLWYWRTKLELDAEEPGDAMTRIRRHPKAGELLGALESWLHRPPGSRTSEAEVAKLLEPYRDVPDPVDLHEPQLAAAGAGGGGRA